MKHIRLYYYIALLLPLLNACVDLSSVKDIERIQAMQSSYRMDLEELKLLDTLALKQRHHAWKNQIDSFARIHSKDTISLQQAYKIDQIHLQFKDVCQILELHRSLGIQIPQHIEALAKLQADLVNRVGPREKYQAAIEYESQVFERKHQLSNLVLQKGKDLLNLKSLVQTDTIK